MTLYQTEGIVIQSLSFKEHDQILTLFTPYHGLFKLFVKGRRRPTLHDQALISPLTRGEFHYALGKGDLHRFRDGSTLNQYLALRDTFESLDAAQKVTQAVLRSQSVGKAAEGLYLLFRLFLEKLGEAKEPKTIVTVFLLKTLKHEGLWDQQPKAYRFAGESFPPEEAPRGSLNFTAEEETLFAHLIHCRSFQEIGALPLSPELHSKIALLFDQALS